MFVERGVCAALTALVGFAAACDRGHHEAPAPSPPLPPPPVPVPHASGCTLAPLPLHVPAPKRLVAIGDLHGDLGGARAALRAAGAIDEDDKWIGGGLVVRQLRCQLE